MQGEGVEPPQPETGGLQPLGFTYTHDLANALGGVRTHNPVRAEGFKPSSYANSVTRAYFPYTFQCGSIAANT